jgi:hypothetical protein
MTLAASGIGTNTKGDKAQISTFNYTGDGSGAFYVHLGFSPQWVKVYDITDQTYFEWCLGMPATDSVKIVGSGPVFSIDSGSTIVANWEAFTQQSVGVYDPAGNGAGDGTIINSGSITVWGIDSTNNHRLQIGANANVSAKVYVGVAMG